MAIAKQTLLRGFTARINFTRGFLLALRNINCYISSLFVGRKRPNIKPSQEGLTLKGWKRLFFYTERVSKNRSNPRREEPRATLMRLLLTFENMLAVQPRIYEFIQNVTKLMPYPFEGLTKRHFLKRPAFTPRQPNLTSALPVYLNKSRST